jgi:hypothetical protein
MTVENIINEILIEWAYRVDNGTPSPKNDEHISVLSEVLNEMGLSAIKDELLQNLREEETKYKNPALNKIVKYKSKDGEDKEGVVGNLLRLKRGTPGREAAEKTLPPEGTPERDSMDNELGSQKKGTTQAQKPSAEKPAADADTKAAQSKMFTDDPAAKASVEKEKDTMDKIAKADAEADSENSFVNKLKNKLKSWGSEEKKFFQNGEHKPGSETRRTLGEAIKDKAKGAIKAIKQGAAHEVHEFKEAGKGVQKFFKGEPLDDHEKKALKSVGIKIATTAVFGAAMGGLSHGAAYFAKHVAVEFIPHVVGETLLKGVGRAAIFADADGEAETEANMIKFAEMIADGIENMEMSPEDLEKIVDGWNTHKAGIVYESIEEADGKQFVNPVLNKVIKYKNAKGEDAEGLIGNLLRLPKEHPGRQAAERQLPPEGSQERDQLNKDLGSEKDGKEQPSAETQPQDQQPEPQQTKSMYSDDPAMKAMLDKEKEVMAKLAKVDEPTTPTKTTEPTDKSGFQPIDAADVQSEIPQADTDAFSGFSTIDTISAEQMKSISMKIDDLARMADEAKAKGLNAPNFNLCKITVPGTNLYCDNNLGIPREEMPQFKGKPQAGSKAESMAKDASGEVDTEPVFREMLAKKGIKVVDTEVPSDALKATQSELVGAKVAGMEKALEENPQHPAITAPIYVSNDGYVLDGHHRWAAIVAYNAAHPDKPIPMQVRVIDEPIEPLVKRSNKFAEEIGIRAKKADTGDAGGPQPIVTPEKKKTEVENIKGKKSGKEIQTINVGNGKVYGTVHRNTKMVDDIVDHVKSTIPKEKWKDVVFVGEGGRTGKDGDIEFHDEMIYGKKKFKEMGAGIDTFDGDELDVHDSQSLLYKNQMKKTGLSHSHIKAGNWASMIGQGEGTDTMSPNDYLDNTGKEFLQKSAKEAGFPPISDFDNPSKKDKKILYRLSFPEDYNDTETKVNDIQVAFNEIRDENIINKSKELEKQGKIPIVVAGEGHVELVKNAMTQKSKISEFSLRSIIKSIK